MWNPDLESNLISEKKLTVDLGRLHPYLNVFGIEIVKYNSLYRIFKWFYLHKTGPTYELLKMNFLTMCAQQTFNQRWIVAKEIFSSILLPTIGKHPSGPQAQPESTYAVCS